MLIFLAFASLSLGFPIDFEKIDSTVHENTSAHVSSPISVSEPLASKSQQFIGLEKDADKLQSAKVGKILQNDCQIDVGANEICTTVDAALATSCSESIYAIELKDQIHVESLVVNKKSVILIKGQDDNSQPRTVWKASEQAASLYTIQLQQEIITLQYIDFVYAMTTESNPVSTPTSSIIYLHTLQEIYSEITIEHCNFIGLGNGLGSQQTNSMLRSEGGQRVIVNDCSFSSANVVNSPIQATDYFQFSVSNCNFTDINSIGASGAIEISGGRSDHFSIAIQSNIFDNCVGSLYGAISVIASNQDTEESVSISFNQITNCTGSVTGGIYLEYDQFGTTDLGMNTFNGNILSLTLQNDDQGQDAHIYKISRGYVGSDSIQYFKIAFQGSKSNQPLSIFFEIDEDQEQGYFSLSTITGECWDTSLGLELFPGCICQPLGQPSGCICTSNVHPTDCACPPDDPNYSYAQCQQDLQPVIPQQCSSITATTPEVDCACPTDAAQLELDPRKDTICKPSTGKESSGSIRAVLNMIVAIVLIPSLALII